jgi:hypothetical protein
MGTEGDSFFVVFTSAHDAVRAAVTAQRALQAHEWPEGAPLRVRMGLHTGEPERHGEGYIGEDVHLAARIGATSHGGQVVLSETTRRLVPELAGDLAGVAFRDLGRHRLKDIHGDTHLYDVLVPGLESRFPPLRSLGRRSALPAPRTALVGRDAEVREVREVLGLLSGGPAADPHRSGWLRQDPHRPRRRGVLDDAYPDGVYFVALDGVEDADAMAGVVADGLDAPAALSTRERLAQQLADRRLLLVLDNLEQIDGAERVAATLLDAGPDVAVLATSRRPLLLAGEQELPVGTLTLPSSDMDAGSSAAVELYVRAAGRARGAARHPSRLRRHRERPPGPAPHPRADHRVELRPARPGGPAGVPAARRLPRPGQPGRGRRRGRRADAPRLGRQPRDVEPGPGDRRRRTPAADVGDDQAVRRRAARRRG